MVVVVPALAEGDQGQDQAVAAEVVGVVAAVADDVGQRVDAEGGVVGQHRAEAEAPGQQLAARGAQLRRVDRQVVAQHVQPHGQGQRRQRVPAVQKAQLGVFREIGNALQLRLGVLGAHDPADVGVEQALHGGRVDVLRLVGILVVMPVMGRPPQRAHLGRRAAEKGQDELEHAPGFVGVVREVAVIAAGQREHADRVGRHHGPEGGPAEAGPEDRQRDDMHKEQRGALDERDIVLVAKEIIADRGAKTGWGGRHADWPFVEPRLFGAAKYGAG